MANETAPLQIRTDDRVACWARALRARGRLSLSVVVKATFTITPGGAVTIAPPAEIVTDDRTFGRNPARSVELAAEVAPFLAKCDVLLTGHAHGGNRPTASVRLGVFRDRIALVDKAVHVFGDRDAAGNPRPFDRIALTYERAWGGAGVESNPVGTASPNLVHPSDPRMPACFAPVSRFWPARKRLLAGIDVSPLFGPGGGVADLPDALPWAYFQAAPADQQASYLRGDEWIVLDGVAPAVRIQTQLSGALARSRVRARGAEAAVSLAADMLVIDAHRMTCSVVWRGRHDLPPDLAEVPAVQIAAALEAPGRAVVWEPLWAAPAASPAPAPPPGAPAAAEGESTLGMAADTHVAASKRVVAPFAVSAPPSAPPSADLSATPFSGPSPAEELAALMRALSG